MFHFFSLYDFSILLYVVVVGRAKGKLEIIKTQYPSDPNCATNEKETCNYFNKSGGKKCYKVKKLYAERKEIGNYFYCVHSF